MEVVALFVGAGFAVFGVLPVLGGRGFVPVFADLGFGAAALVVGWYFVGFGVPGFPGLVSGVVIEGEFLLVDAYVAVVADEGEVVDVGFALGGGF